MRGIIVSMLPPRICFYAPTKSKMRNITVFAATIYPTLDSVSCFMVRTVQFYLNVDNTRRPTDDPDCTLVIMNQRKRHI